MTKTKAAPAAASMPADGMVEGYAATFDRIPDAYGDVIKAGAFADTLKAWQESGKPIPLLYGHSTDDPQYNIGKVVEAHEDEKGLFVRAEFDGDNEKAQYVRKLVQEGRLYQFSFAYEVLDGSTVELDDGAEAYELRKMNLFEVSLVQIPANQRAVVTDVKSAPVEQKDEPAATADMDADAKSGRRNSKADADELRRVLDLCSEIETTVRGLLADEMDETETDEAKAEEPSGANAEEPKADVLAQLKDVAAMLLES